MVSVTNEKNSNVASSPPTGFQVIFREFIKDKLALVSLIGIVLVTAFVFYMAYFVIDLNELMRVSLRDKFAAPGEKFILGADQGGRDIFGQLVIGAKNSLEIAIGVTIITSIFGIVVGLICGYFGGWIDNL